jgi:hypothetical protein
MTTKSLGRLIGHDFAIVAGATMRFLRPITMRLRAGLGEAHPPSLAIAAPDP